MTNSKARVLVVDDEQVVRLSYERSLAADFDAQRADGAGAARMSANRPTWCARPACRGPRDSGAEAIKRQWRNRGRRDHRLSERGFGEAGGAPGRGRAHKPVGPNSERGAQRSSSNGRCASLTRSFYDKAARNGFGGDDDPVVGKSFDRVLSPKGYAVIHAASGAEALARLETENYDMVYTDIKMPEMDGIEVAKRIKASCPWLPVVITATALRRTRRRARGRRG
jgi:CheY-like chemotaxis protein